MKYRILVSEDSPTQAERLRFVLEQAGYEVELARTGKEALARIAARPPDLILSDVVMPEMDGFALCQAVKSDRATSGIPVVMLTSQRTPMDIIVGLQRGADNFVTKPFEDEYLLGRLSRIFENLAHRRRGGMEMEVSVRVGGREIVINADKQQIIELLFSTSEELSQSNLALEEARLELEEQARWLERKVEERTRELRAAEERYRHLVEHIPATVYTAPLDDAGRVTFVSPQVETLVGATPEQVVRDPAWFRKVLHPEDRERVMAELARLTETHQPVTTEFRLVGRHRTVCVNDTLRVVAQESEPAFIQGFVLDVTETRQTEERLRQALKMEVVGQLAGGVAHDFNNLLGVIDGYATLLLKDLPEASAARRRADEIRKAAQRAAALTRQLLAFSRKQVLQPEVVDVNAILVGMEGMLRRVISEDIQIVTALDGDLGRVKADPRQLEQVILNLVVNARDAMPGGGRLTLATRNLEALRHPDAPSGRYVALTVADSGVGMDQATMARIFEPFFTTKEEGKGTGLGLATVYGIVKQSGGQVTVESAPGSGTTFTIHLPRVEAPLPAPAPGPARSESNGGSETVLLVEDEPSLRLVISEMLATAGYSVLEADSAEVAVSLARSHGHAIDLLLTDMVMPRTNGRELALEVQALHPAMRVVYMSGYSAEISRELQRDARVHFIQKPFTNDALMEKMRAALASEPALEPPGRRP